MKKVIKEIIVVSILTIMTLSITSCTNENKIKEKSNLEKCKEYFLTDENKYLETNDSVAGLENYQTTKCYIYKKTDNRIQYILETKMNVGTSDIRVGTSVMEFREDGVYSTVSKWGYKSVEEVPDLIENLDSDDFDMTLLKAPLEVGTSWDSPYGRYSITNIDGDNIRVVKEEVREKNIPQYNITYTKGAGETSLILGKDYPMNADNYALKDKDW